MVLEHKSVIIGLRDRIWINEYESFGFVSETVWCDKALK